MPQFQFLKDYEGKVSRVANFWQLENHNIPATPGVYLLVAKSGVRFRYPAGWSSIYYIGQGGSLRRRLSQHLESHKKVQKNNRGKYPLWEPRHEYGAVFGGRYCFIPTWRGRSPRSLERAVLKLFAEHYHCFPVANGAGAW